MEGEGAKPEGTGVQGEENFEDPGRGGAGLAGAQMGEDQERQTWETS